MRDRRHYKRFFIEGMGIHCRMDSGTAVNLLNLTPAGAYIMLAEKLEVGHEYTLQIEREGLSISVKGEVTSVDSAENEAGKENGYLTAYVVGIKFQPAFKAEDEELLNFIKANLDTKALEEKKQELMVKLTSPGLECLPRGRYHINDISFGGLRLESEQFMEIDSQVSMEVVFSMKKPAIKVTGRVASCKKIPDTIPPLYNIGIEFHDITKKDILRLKDFIYFVQEL